MPVLELIVNVILRFKKRSSENEVRLQATWIKLQLTKKTFAMRSLVYFDTLNNSTNS